MSLTGYNPYTYAPGFRNQEFHHAVLSVSGTWHTLYLDGVQVAQNLSGGNVFASYQTITNTVIGAQTTLSQAFQGTIGDVRVYNYAIQQPLVTSLYRDRELVVYYPFDTSVNSLTPNYATLVYDASLIGQPLISASSGANVGSGALTMTNTAGSVATQYVKTTPGIAGQVGWTLDVTHGITIACWINVAGVADRVQRIFDIPLSVNQKGLAIDISGTNMLYSGWNGPDQSLVLYWPFNTTMNETINNITPTLYGTPSITRSIVAVETGSLNCTTASSAVSYTKADTILPISSAYTFSIWYYPTSSFSGTVARFFSVSDTTSQNNEIALHGGGSGSILYLTIRNGSSGIFGGFSYVPNPTVSLTLNTWNHVVLAIQSNASSIDATFWINGNKTTHLNKGGQGIPAVNRGTMFINRAYVDNPVAGYIDEFRVYTRVLSDIEVQALYNNQNIYLSGRVAYFPFNDTIGSSTITEVISNTSLTATNGTPAVVSSSSRIGTGALDCTSSKFFTTPTISVALSGNATFCFWIKFSVLPSSSYICCIALTSGTNIFMNNASGASFAASTGLIFNFGGYISTPIFTPTDTNTWTHLAITITNSTNWVQYVNGVQVSTGTNALSLSTTYTSATFGNFPGQNQQSNCFLDDVMIYNRALSASEINKVYGALNPGPIDLLSTTAKTAMLNAGTQLSAGAYATKLLYLAYTGPVMTIRNNAATPTSANFYADTNGNLGTAYLAAGTTLAEWLTAASATIAYVSTWYDQTGNANHGTQNTTTLQPVYNQTNKYVDFGTSTTGGQAGAYFNLPTGTVPYNNSSYTVVTKHGTLNTVGSSSGFSIGILGAGLGATNLQNNSFGISNGNRNYTNWWYNNDANSAGVYVPNNVVTFTYLSNSTGSTRAIFLNGTTSAVTITGATRTQNISPASPHYLGTNQIDGAGVSSALNGPLYYMYIAPSVLSDADRLILEST